MRSVIYARFSSDSQREASIEDQVRLCRGVAAARGWEVTEVYADHALSGASVLRPGYQRLLEDMRARRFDIVLAEGLDRLSRDQEHTAALFKQMVFYGVELVTVVEGAVGELHVGLKGTMNALYLKDLAQKTHRGLRGRIEAGRSGGGLYYGYAVLPGTVQADGLPERGLRRVDPIEAEIVRRIFREYAAGSSPKAIARRLSSDGVPGPRGERWRDGTIRGHRQRGTGILNNELYAGRLVWNRQRFVKDPDTGRRLARPNPESEWVVHEVPELRIIDDQLWQAAKQRQSDMDEQPALVAAKATRFWERRRAKHLLTGLLFCGSCGGRYAAVGRDYLACGASVQGGCGHTRRLRRPMLEELILDVLRERLLTPDAVAEFVRCYADETNRSRAEATARRAAQEQLLVKRRAKLAGLYDAIADGFRTPGLLAELRELEAEVGQLRAELDTPPPAPVRLHPNLPELYRAKVEALRTTLADPSIRDAALGVLRGLITRVTVYARSDHEELVVEGAITAMMALGSDRDARLFAGRSGSSVKLVAGARNYRELPALTAAV